MNGYEVFDELCKAHKVTPYQVSKKTGVTTATLSSWKNGRYVPKANKLQKIADYFDISIDVFYAKPKDDVRFIGHQNEYYNPETYEMAQAIFDRPDLHALMKAAMDCEPDQIQSVADMLLRFKEANIDG